jgi:hypothetical protein
MFARTLLTGLREDGDEEVVKLDAEDACRLFELLDVMLYVWREATVGRIARDLVVCRMSGAVSAGMYFS